MDTVPTQTEQTRGDKVMTKGIVLSLYDFTGEALKPWAEPGYECYAFDIQHKGYNVTLHGEGLITYVKMDLHNTNNIETIRAWMDGANVAFGMAFPVCTDLAVSGAAHFKAKAERDPEFQTKARDHAKWC